MKNLKSFGPILEKILKGFFLFLIGCYRTIGTTFLGGSCRFEPSCSEYATQCFNQHPPIKAFKLTLVRLSKCQPFGSEGFDPVPQKEV